uniref:Kit ligand n=1 Tax=Periophthalmus magnuspinnatus TaxID=409849 RepID=A0A3B4BHY3_9GOBI
MVCSSHLQIVNAPYLLLSLFTSLNLCSGKFGQPITDDVRTLALLKQNIPSDYDIPVQYIPKEVAGRCWVVLNIYPLEQSLRRLSDMFGAISSNKDNIVVFIAMLKSLRFTFDHEELETAMQLFQCHYQDGSFLTSLYFDYINDVLNTASEETSSFSCKPPPCLNSHTSPGTSSLIWAHSRRMLQVLICFECALLIVRSQRHSCGVTLEMSKYWRILTLCS